MFGDHLREFHRPGIEAAGVDDEWTDTPPPVARRFQPSPDLRCPIHFWRHCELCDGEGAS